MNRGLVLFLKILFDQHVGHSIPSLRKKSRMADSGPPGRCPGQSRSARHPGRRGPRSARFTRGEMSDSIGAGPGRRRRRTPLPREHRRKTPGGLWPPRPPAFRLRPAAWGGSTSSTIAPVGQGLGPEGEQLILQLRHPLLGGGQLLRSAAPRRPGCPGVLQTAAGPRRGPGRTPGRDTGRPAPRRESPAAPPPETFGRRGP